MNSRNPSRSHPTAPRVLAWTLALALAGTAVAAFATDIADVPLASSSTAVVKPNILFMLDDSGSMNDDSMPDQMGSYTGRTSYRSNRCNTIYYNPSVMYIAPPQLADGTRMPNQSFTAAKVNGFSSTSSTTDLSASFKANSSDTAQPAYYYVLSSGSISGPLDTNCQGGAPSASSSYPHSVTSGTNTWTKVQVTSTSGPGGTDERQNFANWYSYYRTRLMMMKAASARAFVTLSGSYRVGFITINPNSPVTNTKYLRITDFDATQKQSFIDILYSQSTNGSTPLRQALARAGWIYAGQLNTGITSGITDDPVQYSCQQNFTLLTTDGYWNGNRGPDLGNVSVGNQDGVIGATDAYGFNIPVSPRPIFDSSFDSTITTTTTTDSYFLSTSGCSGSKKRVKYNETVQTRVQGFTGGALTSDTTTSTTTNNLNFTSCSTTATLPTPNPKVTTTTTTNNTPSGGSTNSLADVAEYYYKTDLRPSMPNNVPSTGTGAEDDRAPWQHMTTFTMGLGLFGSLTFDPNYKTNTDPTTDFNKIRSGALNWPIPTDNTTVPFDEPQRADDLWHAAVNGRGQTFVATNPDEVVSGLNTALAGVNARVASAAAAATSNLEPVAGDNFAYTASYETVRWVGELQAREINLQTGFVSATPIWSAQGRLDGQAGSDCDNRTIYLFRAGATGNLTPFKWNSDTCDAAGNPVGTPVTTLNAAEQANFGTANVAQLSQYSSMTDGTAGTVDQKTAATGANLVNFVRGQRGKEGFIVNSATGLYRERSHILGDIVSAQPLFIRAPFATYTDAGYANTGGYKDQQASRTAMVYVASNDGMLHAFYAGSSPSDPLGGQERWAFMPTMVLPNLYWLADTNYANLHKFYVDGTPIAGDVYDSTATAWKTIVVAGLNKGGKGYYALDVTDPAAPKALWEFKYSPTCYDATNSSTWSADCNLGYTYGNPIISKLSDGTWAVFVSSGYNNVNGDANDGQGFLYVLNAITGQIMKKIATNTGNATTPSGLGKINNWVDNALFDNTTQRVYGVDLLGNIWRFDVNGAAASGSVAQLVATAKDSVGNPQAITTKPELALVRGEPWVYVATGRYLGTSDISNTQPQSIYAFHDPLTSTASPTVTPVWSDLRTFASIRITNTSINGVLSRTGVCNANCTNTEGWFADFPDAGERVNVDIKLQLGTLTVLTNVPQNDACSIGGYSYINFFDYATGLPISASNGVLGEKLADSLAVGMNIVRLPGGKTVAITTTSDSQQRTQDVPISSPGVTGRRVSWREIGE